MKFFRLFQIQYLIRKYTYKLKLFIRLKIYNIFHVLLLDQDITRKKYVDKNIIRLDFEDSKSKKYKIEAI